VNLAEATIGNLQGTTCQGVAFRSKASSEGREAVRLWDVSDKPNPCDYWDLEVADEHQRLYIKQDVFYILRSKEKLCVPKEVAIDDAESPWAKAVSVASLLHGGFSQVTRIADALEKCG
jgi:hypothetical protein